MGDLAVGGTLPTPRGKGVPVLYLMLWLYRVTTVYLYSAVMFGISFVGGSLSHCFPWLPFDGLSAPWEWKCQRLVAPLSRLVLFIADKHSLISFRDGVGGGGWRVSCYRRRWSCAAWIDAFIITLTGGALSQRSQQLFWKPFLLRSRFNNRTTSFVDLDCE